MPGLNSSPGDRIACAAARVPLLLHALQAPSSSRLATMASKESIPVVVRGGGAVSQAIVKLAPSDTLKPPEGKRAVLEKVYNTWGSCAGSGSDAFPIYRRYRNRELERLEAMDKEYDEKAQIEDFQAKRKALAEADEAATAAKRAKRLRKKQAKDDAKKLSQEAAGINKFAGDGSFLEQMMTLSPAAMEAAEKEEKEKQDERKKAVPAVTVQQMASASNITIRDDEL